MRAGWEAKPFEDCIKKVTYTSKIQRKDFLPNGTYPVISQEEDFINGYWNNEADLFSVETPIVIFGDHTKILKYVDFDFVLGADGVKILPPLDFLEPKFFYYQLQAANLEALGYARHYKLLKAINIAFPTLAEQQRIVAILDLAFEGIAKARANAEQNLQNARALFESHLQSVFTQRGEGWEVKTLNQIAENLDNKRVPITKNVRSNGAYPYYGASGIVDYVGEYIFDDDLLLISEDGANLLARTYPIAFSISGKTWVNNHAHVLRFTDFTTQKLVEFYLNSIPLNDFVSGMAQPKLNQKMLNTIPIPLPSMEIQRSLVAKLGLLREETQRLEVLYQHKIALLNELKKSLLQQAFAGEL